jgi:ferredoxin
LAAVVAAAACALLVVMTAGTARAQDQTLLTSDASVDSVACPAAGACVAVGSYETEGGDPVGLLLSQTAGVWNGSAAAVLPGGASPYPNVNLTSVSCASVGGCAAVGDYVDGGDDQQGLLVNYRRGVWRAGVRVALPAGAAANPQVTVNAVSCAAAGYCTAVGSFLNTAGNPVAFAISESDWLWGTAQALVLAPAAPATGSSSLAAVSCTAIGDCTAIGWYTDAAGAVQGLLLTDSGGQWLPGVEAVLPTTPAAQPNVTLASVACSGPGTCAVVGEYDDARSSQQGLLLSQNDGSWTVGVQAPLPGNALGTQATTLNSVACTGAGYCTAVGQYTDSSGSFQGLLLAQDDGSWQPGVEAVLPAGAASNQDVTLDSVACVAYQTCVVAGNYFSSHPSGLVLSEISGRWKLPLNVRLPAAAASNPYAALNSVACVAGTYCSIAGAYVDNGGNSQGTLLDGNGIYWPQALRAPLPGGLTTALKRHRKTNS